MLLKYVKISAYATGTRHISFYALPLFLTTAIPGRSFIACEEGGGA